MSVFKNSGFIYAAAISLVPSTWQVLNTYLNIKHWIGRHLIFFILLVILLFSEQSLINDVLIVILILSIFSILFITKFLTEKCLVGFHFLYQQEYHYEENKIYFSWSLVTLIQYILFLVFVFVLPILCFTLNFALWNTGFIGVQNYYTWM